MAVERIKNDILSESRDLDNKFADGEILYGIDLNEITRIFRAGINENYGDIIRIVSSYINNSPYAIYQSEEMLPINDVQPNTEVIVLSYTNNDGDIKKGMFLFKYVSDNWTLISELSLKTFRTMLLEFEARLSDVENTRSGNITILGSEQPGGAITGDLWFDTTT